MKTRKILSAFGKCDDLDEFIAECKKAGIGGAYIEPRCEADSKFGRRLRGKGKKVSLEFGIDIIAAYNRKYHCSIDLTQEINAAAGGNGGDGLDFNKVELLVNKKVEEFGDILSKLSNKSVVPLYGEKSHMLRSSDYRSILEGDGRKANV